VGESEGVKTDVPHNVPIPLLRVELDGEAAHLASGLGGAVLAEDGREASEDGRLDADLGEDLCERDVLERRVELEGAVRTGAASVHDALGDALVVKVRDALARDRVVDRGRPARAGTHARVEVVDRDLAEDADVAVAVARAAHRVLLELLELGVGRELADRLDDGRGLRDTVTGVRHVGESRAGVVEELRGESGE